MRRTCLLTLLLLVACAGPAEASWKTYRAKQIAKVVWGDSLATPCPNGFGITYADPATRDDLPENVAGWAWIGVCNVWVNVYNPLGLEWEAFCTTVLHEAGHVAGFDHDYQGRGGIMRAAGMYAKGVGINTKTGVRSVFWSGTDERCAEHGRPFLERAGVMQPVRHGGTHVFMGRRRSL